MMNNNELAFEANRRQFMKMGAGGAALLGGLSFVSQLSGCSSSEPRPAEGFLHLRPQDVELLAPLIVSGMGGVVSSSQQDLALTRLDKLLDSSAPGGRDFIFLLYDALQLGPFRWFVSGTSRHPRDLSADTLDAAFRHWGSHTNNFARIALRGLLQPIQIAWYSHSDTAQSVGYPGPPKKVNAA